VADLAFPVAVFVGVRHGLPVLIGLIFGVVPEGFRFGFAGTWRAMVLRREAGGMLAQPFAVGLAAILATPLIAGSALAGAIAPTGWAMAGAPSSSGWRCRYRPPAVRAGR